MNLNADFYFFSEGCSKAWNFYRGQGHEKVAIVGSDDFGKSEINGEFLDVVTARCFCHLGLSSCAGRGR